MIELRGLTAVRTLFGRMPARVRDAAVAHINRHEVTPLASDIRRHGYAQGAVPAMAASTTRVQSLANGARVTLGGSGTLGAVLTPGAEYGGRRRPKRPYVTRSRNGTPYVIRRRTTMHFRPNLGSRGYFVWPTTRRDLKGIRKRLHDAIVKAVDRG